MDADECRKEIVTLDEIDAASDGDELDRVLSQTILSSSRAQWEMCAQLAELNKCLLAFVRIQTLDIKR